VQQRRDKKTGTGKLKKGVGELHLGVKPDRIPTSWKEGGGQLSGGSRERGNGDAAGVRMSLRKAASKPTRGGQS